MLNELAHPDIPFPNLAWFFFFLPRMSGLYSEIMSENLAQNVFAHSNSCASSSSKDGFFDEKWRWISSFSFDVKKLERSNRDALVS